jgi:Ca-activated chloride channel family protein
VFRYQHPEYFWLLALIPLLLLLWAWWWRWRKIALKQLGASQLILPPVSARNFWIKNLLISLSIGLLAFAWANPQRGAKKETSTQESSDVIVALDISQSMLCADVAPSRLELSKIFIKKLVQKLEGERIGLVFFAGNAFLQMPLSSDYAFIFQSLQSASPDLLTEQGTDIGAAIELAQKSFDPEPGAGRMLVIVTDGESENEEGLDQADEAFDNGTLVCTVAAGTATGGPIPTGGVGDGQYKRDEKGEIVRTRMNEAFLRKIALSGGGQAYQISQGDAAISALENTAHGLQKRSLEQRSFAEFESQYQWFLLPVILLLFMEMALTFTRKKDLVS